MHTKNNTSLDVTPDQRMSTFYDNEEKVMLLDIKDVSKIFLVSVNTIRNWINSGARQYIHDFPQPFKVGREYRWVKEEIQQYINARKEQRGLYGTN